MTESAVRVCVRVRPLVEREKRGLLENAEPVQLFWKSDEKSIYPTDDGNSNKRFSFDRVFSAEETTNQLYQTIAKPLVVSSVEGYNGTIFAYGQTSSGKTFTMMGSDRFPGVIPLAVEDVFQTIKNFPKKEFLLRVSYMEIYNETVTDLLVDSRKRKPLEIREANSKNVYVADLTEELVTCLPQVLAWVRKGEKNRHYEKTKMNQRSSRSHTIFRMIIESREKSDPASGENADGAIIVSHLNLVDLAGSERARQTGTEGARFKEGCNINRSLFILGQVIKKLTDEGQKSFINYRDSKLTRILQNSLGGNAKTLIICTITPTTLDETLGTLQFASTAKKMKNDPHVTEVSDEGALLKRYRNEITDLKRQLEEVSSETQTTATEKEVLSQLLHEKDQLQREQEDKIRNLTKLIVTSSNLVPVQKMPKRRVTWGGKMLSFAHPSAFEDDMYDYSYVEPFSVKRKADSCFMEQAGDEYFDSHWMISEEPPDDMDMSHSSVTVRSFGESPRDVASHEKLCELSQKVSNLELQLEIVSQQKEEAIKNVEALDGKVAELQLKLQTEAQEKKEAHIMEQKVAELEMLLQTEAQEKQKEAHIMKQKVAELEMLLQTEAQEKQKEAHMKQKVAELEMLLQTEAQEKQEEAHIMKQKVAELEMLMQTEAQEKQKEAHKMKQKVAELEMLLQTEAQEKQEAAHIMEQKVAELEMLLQTEAQEKKEAHIMEQKIAELELLRHTEAQEKQKEAHIMEQKVAELEMLMQTEAQEKLETIESLKSRLANLDRRLEEQSNCETQQIRKQFAEAIELCETFTLEKDMLVIERDCVKQELSVLVEKNKHLEQANAALSKELKERKELEEFIMLEDGFRKDHEAELQNEISNLKKARESLELSFQEIQNGKDLVQEVTRLRRSLEDAEGVSRDTKKEWAVLRSQNIDLKERNVTLTADFKKVQSEMTSLRSQLEMEKSRYKKMEMDLQKELNIAFDENTKLTSLLDGKVPQNLIDGMTLERTVASLTQELKTSQKAEETLKAQLEELASLQTLPDKVDSLTKQATESKCLIESLQCEVQEQKQKNLDLMSVLEQKESEFEQHRLSQEKEAEQMLSVHSKEMEKLLSTVASLTTERDQLKLDLQENVELMIENQEELRKSLGENRELAKQIKLLKSAQSSKQDEPDIHSQLEELKANIKTLTEELGSVQAERDCLLSENTRSSQSSNEEMETLHYRVASLSEEKNQLEEVLESLKKEKLQLRAELEETVATLQTEIKAVTEKLEFTEQQRDSMLSEREANSHGSAEELEKLLCQVTLLSAERDQLQEILEGLKQEKQQLREEFEEKIEMLSLTQHAQTEVTSGLQEDHEKLTQLQEEIAELREALLVVTEQKNKAEADLQHSREMTTETENHLHSLQEQLHELKQSNSDMEQINQERQAQQIKTLTKELESARAENRALMLEKDAAGEMSSEKEKVLFRVTLLTEEKDQLQQLLQDLRVEQQQLQADMEERLETVQAEVYSTENQLKTVQEKLQEQIIMNSDLEKINKEKEISLDQQINDLVKKLETVTAERDFLQSERQTITNKMEELESSLTSLGKERDQLQDMVEELRQDKTHLEEELQGRVLTLQNEIKTLTEQLHYTETERDHLLSLKETNTQAFKEEVDLLQSKVTSLSRERDQVLETLQGLTQEKQELRAELEERMKMISAVPEKISQQVQTEKGDVELQDRELLSEVRGSISPPKEQPITAGQITKEVHETLWSQLQNSTDHLQESLGKFQQFINNSKMYKPTPLDKALREKWSWKQMYMGSFPKPTIESYDAVCDLGMEIVHSLIRIQEQLKLQPLGYRVIFNELVEKDLAIFEERRLQDLLLCRVQAPKYSVKDEDFHSLWKFRMNELLDKRQLYLQQMDSILEELTDNLASYLREMKAEISERETFQEELLVVITKQPVNFSLLESILQREHVRRAAELENKRMLIQSIVEQNEQFEKLKQLAAQAASQLREEKSKTSTLLQTMEGVPLKTEVSLLQDNQHLSVQLQQAEENIKVLHLQIEELEDEQTNADRVSNHKQAILHLQNELQDTCALLKQKEVTIQTLKSSLEEAEKNSSSISAALGDARNQLFAMKMKLTLASDDHEQQKLRLTTLLAEREASLRKLKETLRSQQQGEELVLQGKDIYTKLTQPRGVVTESSILLEKLKLEKEVQQLQLKITELESLVSSQQGKIGKWKNRALQLKRGKAEADEPSSPRTGKGLFMTSDSALLLGSPRKFVTPKKILDAPKKALDSPEMLLDAPKVPVLGSSESSFFNSGGNSDILSAIRPRQFFDNSSLGIIPDAGIGADQKNEWMLGSPKPEEMCKTQ